MAGLGGFGLARRRVREAVVVGLVAVRSFIINDAELHFQVRRVVRDRDGRERLGRDPVGAQMEIILRASFRHDHAEAVQGALIQSSETHRKSQSIGAKIVHG